METNDKAVKKKNGLVIEDLNNINPGLLQWPKNITIIDLSGRNLSNIDNVTFPLKLLELNLSHNELQEVEMPILDLEYLKVLNLSFNSIKYFDDTPNFCHTLKQLDLSNNNLLSPPYWIFSDEPESLQKCNLSNNRLITKSLEDDYVKQLLQFKNLVTELYAYNCNLNKHTILFQCFSKLKIVHLGAKEYSHISCNDLLEVPCQGLDKCCDIEIINFCNTNIYTVTPKISMYKSLKELDLSGNNINNLPSEFCELLNLEICILSDNSLLYLPEDMHKLKKLTVLYIDCNKLCYISEDLWKLCNLKLLDLYDNELHEIPNSLEHLEELDLACNYFEEPIDEEYLRKKQKLRGNNKRCDGKKIEVLRSDSEHSPNTTDDEELICSILSNNNINDVPEPQNRPPSSPEDWDSDDYWIPLYDNHVPPQLSPWHFFVKKKIEEGNFCPIDLHTVPVAEKVKYEKLCNPPIEHESDGQFDDYSDDDT